MANPQLQVTIDWRQNGLNLVTNSGFETSAGLGWLGTAGINAAADSKARITTDWFSPGASMQVDTSTTTQSGVNFDFGTTSFVAGRSYTFRAAVMRVSGTTAFKMTLGSLGTAGDRASVTATLTTGWVIYEGTWTPSSSRTDVEIALMTNAAAELVFNVDNVEVYETINDVTADIKAIGWRKGDHAKPAACEIVLWNIGMTGATYTPTDTSGPFDHLIRDGRKVHVRSTYGGVGRGHFYGYIRRIVPRPMEMEVVLYIEDNGAVLQDSSYSQSIFKQDTYAAFRGRILAAAGLDDSIIYAAGPEDGNFHSFADRATSQDVMDQIDRALGSISYWATSYDTDEPYLYVVVDRDEQVDSGTIAEAFDAETIGISDFTNYDVTHELLVNVQRVKPKLIKASGAYGRKSTLTGTVNVLADDVYLHAIPFLDGANSATGNRVLGAGPALSGGPQAAVTTTGGSPVTTFTYYPDKVGIKVSTEGGAATRITSRRLDAQWMTETVSEWVRVEDSASQTAYGKSRGQDIESDYLQTYPKARQRANAIVTRYADPRATPVLIVENHFPNQLERDIGERVTVTMARLGLTDAPFLIRSMETMPVDRTHWITSYQLEEIP